ncbi:PKD domain-containing protein [Methylomicrobium sp. Wu6]|uniref:IgGFc-binding protein n=1 Tax=Methylomicrobium sp. Wu6 TaxID=3107928 RepID=UPI002DD63A74|nr:PKD domain-containing protein [Methylomicrobium sp. Wu6]MEC4748725.1 PKD domain-containing protein [Methylomicrobium sp. Wu6]
MKKATMYAILHKKKRIKADFIAVLIILIVEGKRIMKLKNKSRSLRLLQKQAFVIVSVGVINPVFSAPDNQGKEFVLGFMENYRDDGKPSTISLYLTGPKATTVTVQGAGFGPETFSVVPETITPVTLPVSIRATGSGKIENKGLILSAPDEFVVYGLNQKVFTTDAYLGLPTDVAGTEYIVPSMPNSKTSLTSELQIIAQQDGTEVTVTPHDATIGGPDVKSIKAGKSARFTLNRLQSVQFKAKGGITADLTGSVITSSKPISVFGGHQCAIVPNKALACDHLVEQIPTTNTWGTSFLTIPLATRKDGDIFRILASNDGTTVKIDGTTVAQLKRGQFKQVDLASGSFHEITTSGPAIVIQYSKGTSADQVVSDPFMMMIPPTAQFASDYIVSTPPEAPVAFNNYINIAAPTGQLEGMRLDGAPIATPFTAIGSTGYSGAQVPVGIGAHTINHLSPIVPFGVYSYGFASSDSYGYPGGLRLANIVDRCTPTATVLGDGIDNDCDGRIDEELFNKIDDDGDGRIDEDLAKAKSPVAIIGGPYTVNEGSSITLNGANADPDPNGDESTFEWDLDNDGVFETTGANPTFTGIDGPSVHTVTLRVTNSGGSAEASTTVTVMNVAPMITGLTTGANSSCQATNHLMVNFSDPALLNDTYSAKIDWGDGSSIETINGITSGAVLSHAYAQAGSYTVSVTVSDEDGGISAPVNATLVMSSTSTLTIDPGTFCALSFGESSDLFAKLTVYFSDSAGCNKNYRATVAWSDGSNETVQGIISGDFVEHDFVAAGATGDSFPSATVVVSDGSGGQSAPKGVECFFTD